MFDLKLKETGLMICEEGDLQAERVKLSTFISILSDQETFRQILTARMQRFEMRYETRKKRGFLLMLLVPTVFFLFMLRIQEKMIFLLLWILSMIGISAYLIILEFFHDNLKRKFYLSQKTKTDLINTIQEGQGHQ